MGREALVPQPFLGCRDTAAGSPPGLGLIGIGLHLRLSVRDTSVNRLVLILKGVLGRCDIGRNRDRGRRRSRRSHARADIRGDNHRRITDGIRQKIEDRTDNSSQYFRRACAEIRDALRGTAEQPGKTGAVKDPELEASSASGQGNVTSVNQLKKFLSHYFGTSLESDEACALRILSSYIEDGVGMFEIILTVIRDKDHRLVPGSARIAAVRSLEIGTDTDYRAFRERYQFMLYKSPVCLPITLKVVPKTLYKVVPLRMCGLFVERGAIIRGGRAMIELLPSRPDEYEPIRDHGECPTDSVDRITGGNVTEQHTSGRRQRGDPRYVVMAIDARFFSMENGSMHVTRQGTFASRENIAIGYWRCAYFKEDCSVIYLRPWSYPPNFLSAVTDDPRKCANEVKTTHQATKVEHVREVFSIPCHRCMTAHPIGAHLCTACYLPIFYDRVLPTGDTGGGDRTIAHTGGVVPSWVMKYPNASPALWNNADANAIGMALYSQSPAVDARSLLLSGMRPPKFLDKEDVDGIFEKLHDALRNEILHTKYQDPVDRNVEEWVVKAILARGLAFKR